MSRALQIQDEINELYFAIQQKEEEIQRLNAHQDNEVFVGDIDVRVVNIYAILIVLLLVMSSRLFNPIRIV